MLLWHANVPGVSGGYVGVDVFFVISGFLMTRIIVTEIVGTRRIDLPAFYLRRARRLFPAAAVALLGAAVITVALLPTTRWRDIAGDVAASAVYVVNWRLAEGSVDYLAADDAPSPLQHFWSLAVEEQFYLVWPLLLAAALAVGVRGRHRRPRGHAAAAWAAGGVLVASLAWSAWLTHTDPGPAYFVTTTRLWELALGGLVATAWPRWSARACGPRAAGGLVLVGLAAIFASAVLYDPTTPFPGVAALLPTLGTAAVLLGGPFLAPGGMTQRLLDLRPVLWVGGLSYSLYLWHWPLLVGAAAVIGQPSVPWTVGLPVAVLSLLPAWLSLRFVEEPFRGRARPHGARAALRQLGRWTGRFGLVAAACTAALLGAASVLGPGGLLGGPAMAVSPLPEHAKKDIYRPFYDGGCDSLDPAGAARVCVGGDPEGTRTVALVGDSHAVMWMPAFDAAGREHGWRLELMAKTSCPAADVVPQTAEGARTECVPWREAVLEELAARPRDVVVTAQVPIYPVVLDGEVIPSGDSDPYFADGLVRSWSALQDTGATVVTMAPTPRFRTSRADCVAEHPETPEECGAPAEVALAAVTRPVDAALGEVTDVHVLDLTDLLCPEGTCPAVHDGVLVYIDTNHLSRTRVLQLAGPLGGRLAPLVSADGP